MSSENNQQQQTASSTTVMAPSSPPPLPPSRSLRGNLTPTNSVQNVSENNNESDKGQVTAVVDDSNPQEEEEGANNHHEDQNQEKEEEEPWESLFPPLDITENQSVISDQVVAPGKYRCYKVIIMGKEDDICVLRIHKTIHSGSSNIFVNKPPKENWPTEEQHQWNPTRGLLEGPAGEYYISVFGVPSFTAEDEDEIVQSKEWASYDLYVEWEVLDEKEKLIRQKTKDQYTREKSSAVWASSYNQEFQLKYQEQQQQFEQELQELEDKQKIRTEVNLSTTPVTKDFKIGDTLSDSGVDVIYRVEEIASGKSFAMKVVVKAAAAEAGISANQLKRQAMLLESLKGTPHLVELHKYYDTDEYACFILDIPGKEVLSTIVGNNKYSESDSQIIITQLLEVLDVIHSKEIVHRAIVPDNILWSSNQLTLSGFSSATTLTDKADVSSIPFPSYQAPELIQQTDSGTESDIWQVGIITYILLVGIHPFNDSNTVRMYSKIRQGKFDFSTVEWDEVSASAKDFIKSLICVDKDKRFTSKQALSHPWIKDQAPKQPLTKTRTNIAKNFTLH